MRRRTALGLAMSLAGAALATPAQAAPKAWHVVHAMTSSSQAGANGLAVINAHDVWTIGAIQNSHGWPDSLAQHWDGKKWTSPPLPVPFRAWRDPNHFSSLDTIAASSATNVWAFGREQAADHNLYDYALHWAGHSWTISHKWKTDNLFTHTVVLSPHDVWAFSDTSLGTWHFDGTVWTQISTPAYLHTASALSHSDIWAAGLSTSATRDPVVAHWDGHVWSPVPIPAIPSLPGSAAWFSSIDAISSRDVWVGGAREVKLQGNTISKAVALHWNGKSWTREDPPGGDGLGPIASDGQGGFWAPGGWYTKYPLWHRTGGKWVLAPTPQAKGKSLSITGVARVPGTGVFWATGGYRWVTPGPSFWSTALVLRYP
jgi:hypothetical protein